MNDEVPERRKNEKCVKLTADITDITDEEGLKQAYESKDVLHQHYNKLFIAGIRDWPGDAIDDLKLPMNDTLNKTKRGRDSDSYYRSPHEIDTVHRAFFGRSSCFKFRKTLSKRRG